MSQLSLIESAIDVPLMDIKNVSKLIDSYTEECFYSSDDDANLFFYYRDCSRKLYASSLKTVHKNVLKGIWTDLHIKGFDTEVNLFYPEMRLIENMLITKSN